MTLIKTGSFIFSAEWEAVSSCCKVSCGLELNSCQHRQDEQIIPSSSCVFSSDKTAITPVSMLVLAWWLSLPVPFFPSPQNVLILLQWNWLKEYSVWGIRVAWSCGRKTAMRRLNQSTRQLCFSERELSATFCLRDHYCAGYCVAVLLFYFFFWKKRKKRSQRCYSSSNFIFFCGMKSIFTFWLFHFFDLALIRKCFLISFQLVVNHTESLSRSRKGSRNCL